MSHFAVKVLHRNLRYFVPATLPPRSNDSGRCGWRRRHSRRADGHVFV
jgi:hypothetical protein